jgi:hypothetical protein
MFRTPERSIPLAGDELLARADASQWQDIKARAERTTTELSPTLHA